MQSIEADLVHFTDLVLTATCLFPKQSLASTYIGIRWGGLQVVAVTISHRIIKTRELSIALSTSCKRGVFLDP